MSYTALYWSPAVFGEIHEVHPGIPSFKTWRTAWSLLLMKRIWRTVVYSCDPHCFPPSQKSTALSPKDSQRTHRLPKLTVPQVALPRNRWGGLVFCLVWCVDMLFVFRAIYSKQCIYILMSICLHEIYMFFPYESFCAGWKGYSHWERWGIFRWTSGYLGCCSLEHVD